MLRSGPPTIRRWPRVMTLMMSGRTKKGRTSIALPEAWPDPRASVRSACLALELDPPEDVGRVRPPLNRHLGEWRDLGESWRLSQPWPRLPRSPLRDLWCSDPLVPQGTGSPSNLDLPTAETLDERVFFLSQDLGGRSADSASVALDEVAESALFFVLDPSSPQCHSARLPDGPNPVLLTLGFRAQDSAPEAESQSF